MAITLYDIPAEVGAPWSPNTLKTRISLNYKGLDFKTEWVEYPDIEKTMKAIGANPVGKKADGSGMYSLPAIYDSKTGRAIAESFEIALYLDETYPDKPALFPHESKAAIAAFNYFWEEDVTGMDLMPLVLPETCAKLNARSAEYFKRTREEGFGVKLEEWCPPGPKRVEQWQMVKKWFDTADGLLSKNGDREYFFGDTFSYADAIIIGAVVWVRWAVDPKEWVMVSGWNGGRWGKLVDKTLKLYAT